MLVKSLKAIVVQLRNSVINYMSIFTGLMLITTQSVNALELYVSQGYRDGGKFDFYNDPITLSIEGASATIFTISQTIDSEKNFEFMYNHQGTSLRKNPGDEVLFDLSVDYFHLGGTTLIERKRKTDFYASGGIGATHYSPSNNIGSETRFSMSLGLGMKQYIGDRVTLRLDGKLYGTLLDSGSAIFCSTGGSGCSVEISGALAVQYEVSAGIGIRF